MRIAVLAATTLLAIGGVASAQGQVTSGSAGGTGAANGTSAGSMAAGQMAPTSGTAGGGMTHRHRTHGHHGGNQGRADNTGDSTGRNSPTGSVINSHIDTGGTQSPN